MPQAQIKIGKIRQSLKDVVWNQQWGVREKELPSKRDGIKEVANDLRLRYKSISPLNGTDGFGDS